MGLINGNSLNNLLVGDVNDDQIYGYGGDDTIDGGYGNDSLYGGDGNDTIYGSYSNDKLDGGYGDDILYGDTGEDILEGSYGDDRLYGGAQSDRLSGGENNDLLKGGSEDDILEGGYGNDILNGDEGNDSLDGGGNDDILIGSTGNDTLNGGGGMDSADYSQRYQQIILTAIDRIDKGTLGIDQLINIEKIIANGSYLHDIIDASTWGDNASINANLQTQTLSVSNSSGVKTVSVINFDHVYGTSRNDIITGNTGNNQLFGNGGDDTIRGSGGSDTLDGGTGNNRADYSQLGQSITFLPSNTVKKSNLGTDQLIGIQTIVADRNASNNTIDVSSLTNITSINANLAAQTVTVNGSQSWTMVNFDDVKGTNQVDSLIGDTQDNQLFGYGGNDTINGGYGNDSLYGGDGNDTIYGSYSNDKLDGGYGDDILYGDTGEDTLEGSYGDDRLYGGAQSDRLSGGENNDLLKGGSEDDILKGGYGNDILNGDEGNDSLDGGGNDDILIGSTGNDTLNGGGGMDIADYSQMSRQLVLTAIDRINKDTLGLDQLINIEKIIANSNVNHHIIDATTWGDNATINVNLQTQTLSVSNSSGVKTVSVINFDHVKGTNHNDIITGDTQNNQLFGNGGDDTIRGSGGSDTLDGGTGNDSADYSQLGQSITFLASNIVKKSHLGTDQLIGIQTIVADATTANNTIDVFGLSDITFISANLATKTVTVNGSQSWTVVNFDDVKGTNQADSLIGDNQDNQLFGYGGDDTINGGYGNDVLYGGSGNNTLNGGDDYDTADYSQITKNITFLQTGVLQKDGGLGQDQLVQIEKVLVNANTGSNTIDASTADANTSINVNLNYQFFDVIELSEIKSFAVENFDHVKGSNQDDDIVGDSQNNLLIGNGGNDFLDGFEGNDQLNGGSGDDYIWGYFGNDSLIGGSGNDTLMGEGDDDTLIGDDGDDSLMGGDGNDILTGGLGQDNFVFNNVSEGIDIIKDFNLGQGDKIHIYQVIFGSTNISDFAYDASTGGLLFAGTKFATIENKPLGFTTNLHIEFI
ncbi:MAG TPA: hypothetical protein IGS40_16640 [Trichormus sp. M33_DOE_039]|nr:hypothetical protein [Trichormus sp. M33_DOE_039]